MEILPLNISSILLANDELNKSFPKRFWAKVRKGSDLECWEWFGSKDGCGYGMIGRGSGNGNIRASRASWILHRGNIPRGMVICHTCDNPGCVNPIHLFMGTMKDNSQDMIRKGRGNKSKGETQHSHKFTEDIVRQIRSDYAAICPDGNTFSGQRLGGKTGMSHRTLAAKYGVNRSSIRKIVNRMTWKHL